MNALVTGVSAAGGFVLGDGIEILVDRLGERRPLDRPWWRCPVCEAPAHRPRPRPRRPCPRRDVGDARRAAATGPHPLRPAVLAVVSAAVLGAFAARFGADVVLAAYAVFGLSMVAISAVDLERYIIPNRIIYPTLALLIPLLVVASAVDHRWGSLGRAAIAGAVAFTRLLRPPRDRPRGAWVSVTCAWPESSAWPSAGSARPRLRGLLRRLRPRRRHRDRHHRRHRRGPQDQDPLRALPGRRRRHVHRLGQPPRPTRCSTVAV